MKTNTLTVQVLGSSACITAEGDDTSDTPYLGGRRTIRLDITPEQARTLALEILTQMGWDVFNVGSLTRAQSP